MKRLPRINLVPHWMQYQGNHIKFSKEIKGTLSVSIWLDGALKKMAIDYYSWIACIEFIRSDFLFGEHIDMHMDVLTAACIWRHSDKLNS